MKKRFFSLFCIFGLVLVFGLTAHYSKLVIVSGVDESSSTTKSTAVEVPVEPSSSTSASSTNPPMPTKESTSTQTESSSEPKTSDPASTSQTNPTDPSQTDPTEHPGTTNHEEPGTSETSTSQSGTTKPSTTKKSGGDNRTTTKRNSGTTAAYTTVPRMTVPVVENTTVAGTTMNPMDAYYERISGMTFANEVESTDQTHTASTEDGNNSGFFSNLSTPAIIAIVVGGIALLTIALTMIFVLRNKRAAEDDDAADNGGYPVPQTQDLPDPYMQQAVNNDPFVQDGYPTDTVPGQVQETGTFTVVSLDDKDYID